MRLIFATACLSIIPTAQAVDASWNGFLTLAAGKVVQGTVNGKNEMGRQCPCLITDFSQNAVLTENWGLDDSKLGLQGSLQFSPDWSLTGQAVVRGSRDFKPNLEWVYLSWQASDSSTVQIGRKRLPLFYYSEQQDIGFTYPWVHLPPQTYGWEAVNYNGINWNWQWVAGDWSGIVNSFVGTETRRDNDYWKLYYEPGVQVDTKWDKIAGVELIGSKGWFEGRLMLMRSENSGREQGQPWSASSQQLILGASALADFGDWFGSTELFFSDRTESYGRDLAYSLTVGRRFGAYSVVVTHGLYQQKVTRDNPDEITYDDREVHRMNSLVLRYELNDASAIKLQFDDWNDYSGAWFASNYGDARAISVSYDLVF